MVSWYYNHGKHCVHEVLAMMGHQPPYQHKFFAEAFKRFFERIAWQCVEAGLVDGKKLFVDASLIDANASNSSVIDKERVKKDTSKSYHRFEERLDDLEVSKTSPVNRRFVSTTDPDASVARQSVGKSELRYKAHRVVDPKHEVITATQVSPGAGSPQPLTALFWAATADRTSGSTRSSLRCFSEGSPPAR